MIDDRSLLSDLLSEVDLSSFENLLAEKLQITRLEHFEHVKETDLKSIGLSQPAIRRLLKHAKEKRATLRKSGLSEKLKKYESSPNLKNKDLTLSSDGQSSSSTCLILKEDIKLMEKLGEGSFGVVKRAWWNQGFGRKVDVAVKLLRNSETLDDDFILEINALHRLKHPNLIRLYGLVMTKPLMMVVELCLGGSLLERLRNSKKPTILVSRLVDYAKQIVEGMAYLEAKRLIHRDLAARNVLLADENEKIAKIGDFGLMRSLENKDDYYVMNAEKKIPFAWCPPEALKQRKFSHASDVWSFGVTLWEMFSFGEEPWCGYSGPEIINRISANEKLAKLPSCPSIFYALMLDCWSVDPTQRSTFASLKQRLKNIELRIGICKDAQKQEQILSMDIDDKIIVIDGESSIPISILHGNQNVIGTASKLAQEFKVNFLMNPRMSGGFQLNVEENPEMTTSDMEFKIFWDKFFPIISANQYYWYGQNEKSRKLGKFARKCITLSNQSKSKEISQPLKGSFVHTGHGDAKGGESWGCPEKIDDIYLRNPMPLIDLNENATPTTLRHSSSHMVASYSSSRQNFDEPSTSDRYYAPVASEYYSAAWSDTNVAESKCSDPSRFYDDVPQDPETYTKPPANDLSKVTPSVKNLSLPLQYTGISKPIPEPFKKELASRLISLQQKNQYFGTWHPSNLQNQTPKAPSPQKQLSVFDSYKATSNPDLQIRPTGSVLQSTVSYNHQTTKSSVDKQLLAQFDPLEEKPPQNLVSAVHEQVPFASLDRCAQLLRRCKMNVAESVEQLKLEKLIDMNLADRETCQRALQRCSWDIERAASSILD